jgi:hypothetical protein
MARRAPIAFVFVVSTLALSHCAQQRQGQSEPTSAPTVQLSASPLVPTPNSAVPSALLPPPQPSASAPNAPPAPTFVINTIKCGQKLCNIANETCCSYGGEYDCRRRAPMGTGKQVEAKLSAQLAVCNDSPPSGLSLTEILYCDDSSDCPANQVCCAQWLWSGASFNSCVPARSDGKNACELVEACVIRGNCRTANTYCEASKCALKDAHVRCNGGGCDGVTPVCCSINQDSGPRCVAERDCVPPADNENGPFPVRHECSGPSSCPRGMYCQLGLLSTYCSGMRDAANSTLVCDNVRDCSIEECRVMGNKGPVKCEMDKERGFSVCTCH